MGIFTDNLRTYSEYNLAVIPTKGKKPAITDWTLYCREVPDDAIIEKWEKDFSKHNGIGLTAGEANHIIIADWDFVWPDTKEEQEALLVQGITEEIFEKERAELEAKFIGLLPNTPCKKRGKPGKWSAFFRPGSDAQNYSVNRYGVRVFDILYDGRQTVLPPTIHPETKKPYEWIGRDLISSLDDLPTLNITELMKFGDLIRTENKKTDEKNKSGRNDELKKAVFGMFARGIIPENCVEHLLQIDQEKNLMPLFSDKKEFPRLWKTPHKAALQFAKSNYKSFKNNIKKDAPEKNNETKVEIKGFYECKWIPKDDGGMKYIEIPLYKEMASHCYNQKNMCFDDATSLKFDGKKWSWLSKTAFNNFIVENNLECIKPFHIDNFAKMIRSRCFQDALEIVHPEAMVNVNNGIIDVKSGELLPHNYKYLFRYCSPVDYSSGAECPRWEQFLLEVFENNVELIDLAQRLFGYIIIGGRPFLHKAFVLTGSGRNGKSTFLDVLRAVIGSDSYSTVSMAKLDKEFSLVNIDGMLANVVEESPSDEINAEVFKTLVGGGEVQAAHKGMDEYKFRCNARFVFACNDMPIFKDKSVGLEDRLVFIPFNRYFKESERDTSITEKLLAELPGIFNWAIKGAKTILAERSIPTYDATKQAKEQYRLETNPLYAWFKETIEITQGAPILSLDNIYSRYVLDMERDGNRALSKNNFAKNFRKYVSETCSEKGIFYNHALRSAGGKSRIFDVVKFCDSSDRTPFSPVTKFFNDIN